jgi:hypothetical protein
MSLRSKIKKAVEGAFLALGDLVEDATLSLKKSSSYNFSTGETQGDSETASCKVVLLEQMKTEEGYVTKAILYKEATITETVSPFRTLPYSLGVVEGNSLSVSNEVYYIEDPVDNGYTIECNLRKGAAS